MPLAMGHALAVAPVVTRIKLEPELSLARMPGLIRDLASAYTSGAARIELDVSRLRKISEGARRLLATATTRLEGLGVELVLIDSGRPGFSATGRSNVERPML